MGQPGGNPSQLPRQSERWHRGGIKHGNSQLRKHNKLLSASLPMPGSGRTLRETVLESSPILALLNESFISSWSLVKELEELQVSVTATSAFFAFGAGERRRCLARGCQQEGRAHTCASGGFQFQALCVLAIAGAKQTPDGGRLKKWHNDPLRSVMVPILKAKPDASL